MGAVSSYFSKQPSNPKLNDLDQADLNGDGVVTRSEFEQWIVSNDRQQSLEYQSLLASRDVTIHDLRKQVKELTKVNEQLRTTHHHHHTKSRGRGTEPIDNPDGNTTVNALSKEKINEFVEELLNDENINIKYLPDYVERQLYRNIFTIAIGVLEKLLNTTEINMIGHQVKLSMQPQVDKDTNNNEETVEPEKKKSEKRLHRGSSRMKIKDHEEDKEDESDHEEKEDEGAEESHHGKFSGFIRKKEKKEKKHKKDK